ncbi:MAG: hypothetical protein AB7T37_02090 [Dehalococcoidia bacterium]
MPVRRARTSALTAVLFVLGGAVGLACDRSDPPPATATPSVAPSPTAELTPTPTPSPTPDPLAPPPATRREALDRLQPVLAAERPPACLAPVLQTWAASCESGDIDGDGVDDVAFLVPLQGGAGLSPSPAAVVIHTSGSRAATVFPAAEDADASPLGRAAFSVADRDGAGGLDVSFIATRCGASNCSSTVEIVSWDGTSWRNIGPANVAFDNPESIMFEGQGAATALVVRAGVLGSVGAGPTRMTKSTFKLASSAFVLVAAMPDPPTYLFHAALDADALFDAGKFAPAITAYEALIDTASLKDWQEELGQRPGRGTLESYARFRIAVATAAMGGDPTAAIDAVITDADDALFVEGIQAFRRGFQQAGSVTAACLEATRYFSTLVAARLIDERFDYGYGNPRKKATDICPL